jgi:hypothetical protein
METQARRNFVASLDLNWRSSCNGEEIMATRTIALTVAAVAIATWAMPIPSAQSLTMKECSAKYKAAQADGTAKGLKWNDFRKAECGSNATAAPAESGSPAAAASKSGTSSAPQSAAKGTAKSSRPSATTGIGTAGNAVFPTAVSPKYSKESAGRARMHTCLDQYNANKADNQNGGMQWIQKGGGYYSECNKRLKGAA